MKLFTLLIFLSITLFVHGQQNPMEHTKDDTFCDLCHEMEVTFLTYANTNLKIPLDSVCKLNTL